MAIDYELILSKSLNEITKIIDGHLLSTDESKTEFYNCCKQCLKAVIAHSENSSKKSLELSAETSNTERRKELQQISEIFKKVPTNSPKTSYEAVQSIHFITYCLTLNPFKPVWQQFQFGHPDRYLLPFYENDIKNGKLTKQFVQEILDCLGIQINMHVPSALSNGYMVGSRDENDSVVENELTEMCMQVVEDIRLVYPAVGLCYTEDMSEKHIDKACDLLSNRYSHPALFNDDIITKGLIYYSVDEKQAHNYIHSTCVEITPTAASNVWVASLYTNMPQLLLDIMDKEYFSFNLLLKTYFEKLDASIKTNFESENEKRAVRAKNPMNPLLLCFVNDLLETRDRH